MGLPEELPLTTHELKKLFAAAGYKTQGEVASALRVTTSTVCKWLSGERRLSEKAKEAIRSIPVVPGAERTWSDYLAEVPATIAHYKASLPPLEADPLDPKVLAEAIAKDLAPVLKVNPEELADLVAEKIGPAKIAPDVAAQLLPEVRKVVEEVAQKFKEVGQEDTSEAVEKALAACAERLAPLLKQNTSEARSRFDELATAFKHALDAMGAVFKNGLDALGTGVQGLGAGVQGLGAGVQGLGSEVQQLYAREGAVENGVQGLHAKADAMRAEVQQLQAKADAAGNGIQHLQTKADAAGNGIQQLQAQMGAQDDQSARRHRVEMGTMVLGFAAVVAVMVACTSYLASKPISGSEQTRGGGVAEGAAGQGRWWKWGDRLSRGVNETMGERKVGRPMPHSPLPGQAVAPCTGAEKTVFGACWYKLADPPPCDPTVFEYDHACYVPVRADPNVPVGTEPKRSGQETPSKEKDSAGMPGKQQE